VLAYITYEQRLLVFEQPDFPDAGVQVPGGTLEPGESPAEGALREAFEETGLQGLRLVRFLGVQLYAASDGRTLQRHYFQLAPSAPPPSEWEHWEQSPSTGEPPIRLRLRWVSLDAVPPLAGGRDALLGELAR